MKDLLRLKNNEVKYKEFQDFIKEYWEDLTYEELIIELARWFGVTLTRESINTLRDSMGLSPKSEIKASKRKTFKVEIPEKIARAVFLEHWDMKSFMKVEEQSEMYRLRKEEIERNQDKREIENFGRVFRVEPHERGRAGLEFLNGERIKRRRRIN